MKHFTAFFTCLLLAIAIFVLGAIAQDYDYSSARSSRPWPQLTYFPGACKLGQIITRIDIGTSPGTTYQCDNAGNWQPFGGSAATGTFVVSAGVLAANQVPVGTGTGTQGQSTPVTVNPVTGDIGIQAGSGVTGNIGTVGAGTFGQGVTAGPNGSGILGELWNTTGPPGVFTAFLRWASDPTANFNIYFPFDTIGATNQYLVSTTLTQTLTNKTLQAAVYQDANGNTAFATQTVASAVDHICLGEAASANPAQVAIAPCGQDTNQNLVLSAVGSGLILSTATTLGVIHVAGTGTAPLTNVVGSPLGTGGTCTVSSDSTDKSGEVSITIGSTASTPSVELCEIVFTKPYLTNPFMSFTISNGAANSLALAIRPFYIRGNGSGSYMSIQGGSTAIPAGSGPLKYTYAAN